MTTEAMSNTELFELCKAVYEATGWDSHDQWFMTNVNHPNDVIAKARPRILTIDREYEAGYRTDTPLYTSDYLLEKLPAKLRRNTSNQKRTETLRLFKRVGQIYVAGYSGIIYLSAGTPLLALLKLTLALKQENLL